jgi:hypothetical protein
MPAVPELNRASPILPLRYGAFEIAIVERVVFHFDCEAFVAGIERWPLGNGPGLEYAVELQPKIIMQPARVVLLDDKAELIRRLGSASSRRFASLGKIPFGEVCR